MPPGLRLVTEGERERREIAMARYLAEQNRAELRRRETRASWAIVGGALLLAGIVGFVQLVLSLP